MNEKRQLIDILNSAIGEALSNLHTATIAKVTGVQAKTISVQPVINRVVDGKSITLPQFTKVPPLFMQGGESYTAHPIAVGNYCLLMITERCFDRWYSGADFQDPAEFRMHDYSDGIAIVGVNPQAGALTIPDVIQQTGDTNQDGNYTRQGSLVQIGDMTITGDTNQDGNYTQQGDRTQTGDQTIIGDLHVDGNVTVTGNITCQGTIAAGNYTGLAGGAMTASVSIETTADFVASGISLNSHTHPGDSGGTTGGPQ